MVAACALFCKLKNDTLLKKIDFRVFPFSFASSAPLAVICSGMYEQWSFTDTRALVASIKHYSQRKTGKHESRFFLQKVKNWNIDFFSLNMSCGICGRRFCATVTAFGGPIPPPWVSCMTYLADAP